MRDPRLLAFCDKYPRGSISVPVSHQLLMSVSPECQLATCKCCNLGEGQATLRMVILGDRSSQPGRTLDDLLKFGDQIEDPYTGGRLRQL